MFGLKSTDDRNFFLSVYSHYNTDMSFTENDTFKNYFVGFMGLIGLGVGFLKRKTLYGTPILS